MVNHIMGIDHAIVGVRDLAHARTTYERLGFHVTPHEDVMWVGVRPTTASCSRPTMSNFSVSSIPSNLPTISIAFWRHAKASCRWRCAPPIPEGTHEAWRSGGTRSLAEVSDLSRLLETEVELRFKNVVLAPATTGELPLLACAHRSRRS